PREHVGRVGRYAQVVVAPRARVRRLRYRGATHAIDGAGVGPLQTDILLGAQVVIAPAVGVAGLVDLGAGQAGDGARAVPEEGRGAVGALHGRRRLLAAAL